MPDRVQPGVRIDSALWQEFKNEVKRRKGGVRGHTRSELETAIRLYIGDESEVSGIQVNNRLARIESELGIEATDGGTQTVERSEHTHAPETKPAANSATEKKIAWLAEQVEAEAGADFGEIPRAVLRDVVKDEYGFRSDTAKRYVEELIDHFDLVEHPNADPLLATESRREELIAETREQLKDEAEEQL